MLPPVKVYPSRSKLARYVVTSGLLAVFFEMTVLYHTQWHSEAFWYVVALLSVPIALAAMLYWLYRLVNRTPLLTVNDVGIRDQSSLTGIGLVRWDEIAHIALTTTRTFSSTQTAFTIILRDAAQRRQHFSLRRLPLWLGDDAITISQTLFPISMPTLFAQVKEYYTTAIAPRHQPDIAFDAVDQSAAA